MKTKEIEYSYSGQCLKGYLAYDNSYETLRPAVMVVHDWSGRNAFACKKAEMLAQMGYVGFAVDMYGDAKTAEAEEEKRALMEPVINVRSLLRGRMRAAFDAVTGLHYVNKQHIVAIGFCFGGLCVLDLARTGLEMAGVVSFHGLLNKPDSLETQPIKAKVLVLHGYDDPMVRPTQVNTFCDEMTRAGADWQVHLYGHTLHAFTNPQAKDPVLGTVYNPKAEERSLIAMTDFLNELFG